MIKVFLPVLRIFNVLLLFVYLSTLFLSLEIANLILPYSDTAGTGTYTLEVLVPNSTY